MKTEKQQKMYDAYQRLQQVSLSSSIEEVRKLSLEYQIACDEFIAEYYEDSKR